MQVCPAPVTQQNPQCGKHLGGWHSCCTSYTVFKDIDVTGHKLFITSGLHAQFLLMIDDFKSGRRASGYLRAEPDSVLTADCQERVIPVDSSASQQLSQHISHNQSEYILDVVYADLLVVD